MLQQALPIVAETGRKLTTEDIQPWHRKAWLREVIGREYADVDIIPPATASLFNEMTIYPWQDIFNVSNIMGNSVDQQAMRDLWFHDLFKADGSPYDPAEIELFQRYTAVNSLSSPGVPVPEYSI